MELARGNHAVAGQARPVINRAGSQIDPQVAIFPGPDSPRTSAESRGGFPRSVVVSVGLGLGAQIEDVDVEPSDGFLFLEVLFDDLVDGGVRDGEGVRGPEGGRGVGDLGF